MVLIRYRQRHHGDLGGVASGGGGGVGSLTLVGHIGDIAGASVNSVGHGLDTAI